MKSYLIYQKPRKLGQMILFGSSATRFRFYALFSITQAVRAAENVDKAAIMNTWSEKWSEI